MVFRARWTELKKLGSKSKGPTGLSNLHTSIEPSKTKKGVRGQDYFVGEEELMRYLDRLDLDEPDSDTQPASGATASTASGAADTQHASDAPEIGANGAAGHSRGVVEPATGRQRIINRTVRRGYSREVSSPETEPAPEPLNDCASLPEAEIFTSEERTNGESS
ncbi:hypothetical protein PC120_g26286 [Phytophthora cactorum]|nr:hypothetical protein PC120_g26286 [Phytophthora cactorum]